MSILIKGMEMPKGCITCMFKSESLFNRTMWCEWLDDSLGDYSKCDEEWRHPDCPLVEVSTPHGRLIDADAVAEDLGFDVENDQIALDQMDFVGKEREHIQFDKDCKQNCMWYLSEAPTIIEAEEGEDA